MHNPFEGISPIGTVPLEQAASILDELGDGEAAAAVRLALKSQAAQRNIGGGVKPYSLGSILGKPAKWAHSAHTLGFIPAGEREGVQKILNAGSIPADRTLQGQPLRVALNALCIASYPGYGLHHVLLDFYSQCASNADTEHLHFNATYRVQDGEHSGVIGQPIFVGLRAGAGGLSLRCLTVNVKNEDDERLIAFLDRDVFKAGLKLLETAQPAVAPLSEMALGLVTGLAKRARNVPVQDIYLGLDFGSSAGGARLAQGTYVAVQIAETQCLAWRWDDWVFDHAAGRIVLRSDRTTLVPYNYLAFSVEKCEASAPA
jgi:hypothetical protein